MNVKRLIVGVLALLWLVQPAKAVRCGGVCDCDYDFGTVDCQNKGLRYVPDFDDINPRTYDELNLKHNRITFLDFAKLKDFRLINVLDNPINCGHGLMNVESLSAYNIVLIDCVIPGINTRYPPTHRHIPTSTEAGSDYADTVITDSGLSTDSQVSTDSQLSTTKRDAEKVTMAAGVLGEADAFTKGKLEIAWGISTSLTIVGILGGVITCWTLTKILRKLKAVEYRLKRADDFHSDPPAQKGIKLFDDLSSRVSAALSSSVGPSNSDSTSNGTEQQASNHSAHWHKSRASRVNFTWDAFGGSSSDEDDETDNLCTPRDDDEGGDGGSGTANMVTKASVHVSKNPFFRIRPTRFSTSPPSDTLAAQIEDITISDSSSYRNPQKNSSDSE